MDQTDFNPARILDVGLAFEQSKTLLSAVSLELFTHLGEDAMTGEEIGQRLELHPRAIHDFLDALVALRFLERDGDGPAGRYRNSAEASAFLDKSKPSYVGGLLEMCDARLYGFWGDLTEGLKTGQPQNELKHTGKSFSEELYSDSARLEQFMHAMAGLSAENCNVLAEKVDFSRYQTVCDLGGASRTVAWATSFDE